MKKFHVIVFHAPSGDVIAKRIVDGYDASGSRAAHLAKLIIEQEVALGASASELRFVILSDSGKIYASR
jgi:hypothetical protein